MRLFDCRNYRELSRYRALVPERFECAGRPLATSNCVAASRYPDVDGRAHVQRGLRRRRRGLGVCAHVPELPEVQTQGEDLADARAMVREATAVVLDERRARGESIPPTGWALVEAVEIAA